MQITSFLLGISLLMLINGCAPKQTDNKPTGVLTENQEKTLKKAKQVESLLEETNNQRIKQIDTMD